MLTTCCVSVNLFHYLIFVNKMEQLIRESLLKIVDDDLCDDLVQYILSVDDEADFEEYMRNLFDFSVKEQRELYDKIKSDKFGKKGKNKNYDTRTSGSQIQEQASQQQELETTPDSAKKKTKKFRKFQLNELQKGYLRQGRCPCECQATKHNLINNCIECGRIVCEQEGSGPCFFCEAMVCTKEEQEILDSATKEGDALYRTLTDRKTSEKARNKLLHYDQTGSAQTRIIDDEHDYYAINNRWSSAGERAVAAQRVEREHEQRHGSRLGARSIVLDLTRREVHEQGRYTTSSSSAETDHQEASRSSEGEGEGYSPQVPDITALLESLKTDKVNFTEQEADLQLGQESSKSLLDEYVIQDAGYLQMRDRGVCLSMHQPWASLLVAGIKQHEGRSWYTPHRGALWIASTAQPADVEMVDQMEAFYRDYHNKPELAFPDAYPAGCVLGRVLLDDVLAQHEYQEVFPHGESDSPYVFICSDPQKLMVPIPIKGEHKLYKLPPALHKMASDSLILKRRLAI